MGFFHNAAGYECILWAVFVKIYAIGIWSKWGGGYRQGLVCSCHHIDRCKLVVYIHINKKTSTLLSATSIAFNFIHWWQNFLHFSLQIKDLNTVSQNCVAKDIAKDVIKVSLNCSGVPYTAGKSSQEPILLVPGSTTSYWSLLIEAKPASQAL